MLFVCAACLGWRILHHDSDTLHGYAIRAGCILQAASVCGGNAVLAACIQCKYKVWQAIIVVTHVYARVLVDLRECDFSLPCMAYLTGML